MLGLCTLTSVCGASPTKGIMPLPPVPEYLRHGGAVQPAQGAGNHRAHEGGHAGHETLVINYVMSLKSVLPAPKPRTPGGAGGR